MAYPFVAAKWFSPGKIIEYRAIVIHMAEGGGTVGYLKNPPRDVSASHVIEYSGRIVQMVKDGDASHCQFVSPEPYKSPDYGIFSSSIGRQVLGTDGWADVNRWVFAVEIEGFRAMGPNPAQTASLIVLTRDLRHRFPTIRGLLGHRDVQDKPCPGGLIPWGKLGGHGLLTEDTMDPYLLKPSLVCKVTGPVTVYSRSDRVGGALPGFTSFAGGDSIFLFCEAKRPTEPDGQSVLVPILLDLASGPPEDLRIGWVGVDRVSNVRPVVQKDCAPEVQAAVDQNEAKWEEWVRTHP